ncbi:hypothetical protein GCM10023322_71410 [Rugosimonospora acidiphila]|uniref:Secreted protein n=1 Tax=Rugosimonospora acidiphila TaxID=556531 RepID=A0ABP9SKW6_9ACTN
MKRLVKGLLATAVASVVVVGGLSAPAQAGSGLLYRWEVAGGAGYIYFNQDPGDGLPGDSIQACDDASDGWGVIVYLDTNRDGVTDRTATTQGHPNGYCTGFKGGNIAENQSVWVHGAMIDGNLVEDVTPTYEVKA